MTGAAGWAASWSAAAVIAVSAVILHHFGRHGHRLPAFVHPWLLRAVIVAMYAAGCAVVLTPLGRYPIAAEDWLAGVSGGAGHGAAGAVLTGMCVFVFLAVLIGIIWVPDPAVAWWALSLPFIAALSGGHLHRLLTAFPVIQWVQDIAHWIGG